MSWAVIAQRQVLLSLASAEGRSKREVPPYVDQDPRAKDPLLPGIADQPLSRAITWSLPCRRSGGIRRGTEARWLLCVRCVLSCLTK